MRFDFRTKLSAIVGAIALGFLLLMTSELIIARRVDQQLSKIHEYYIPLIKVGPRLDSQFDHIMRGLQDAVAAHDEDALEATASLNRSLLDDLKSSASVLYPDEPGRVENLITHETDLYTIAHDVSLRLMKGETGMPIVNSIAEMKSKYAQTNEILQRAIIFDEPRLTEAFNSVKQAMSNANHFSLLIIALCLIFVTAFSMWIVRGVLRSGRALMDGLVRFSEGNFETPIQVVSRDEFGDVAQTANRMSQQIQSLMVALQATNKELESFSYSVAHDLRAPLRAAIGFSLALEEDYEATLPPDAKGMLHQISNASKKMGELIDGLLSLSRIARSELVEEKVNLSDIAQDTLETLQRGDPERKVKTIVENEVMTRGDPRLLQIVLGNLIGNAWKFTNKREEAQIEFGKLIEKGRTVFFVRDNGAGFDMRYANKLFGVFQRLHTDTDFEGTGIGLATVQRIIHRHQGNIWAESEPDHGATFFFELG